MPGNTGTKHEGVSCDACMKSNFRGRRYKCLMCYDYDLCGQCRDAKSITGRHTMDHPMQCILTRLDMEMYYGGETIPFDQGQCFTCPYCGDMGFSDLDLADHLGLKHPNSINDVICPICSTMQGGDPNHVTEDLLAHLSSDHQPATDNTSGRSLGSGRGRYRLPPSGPTMIRRRGQHRPGGPSTGPSHTSDTSSSLASRAGGLSRATSNRSGGDMSPSDLAAVQHLLPPASALSASIRESADPISDLQFTGFAELLSQLTSVGRSAGQSGSSGLTAGQAAHASSAAASATSAALADTASSLQQLQMQLQLERQNLLFGRLADSTRLASGSSSRGGGESAHPLDPRLAAAYMSGLAPFGSASRQASQATAQATASPAVGPSAKPKKEKEGYSLLEKLMDEKSVDDQKENTSDERANRALFIQELLIGTLSDEFEAADHAVEERKIDNTEV